MKTKVLILIAGVAILTLSFTFASSSRTQKQQVTKGTERTNYSEPVGGFASEDKL